MFSFSFKPQPTQVLLLLLCLIFFASCGSTKTSYSNNNQDFVTASPSVQSSSAVPNPVQIENIDCNRPDQYSIEVSTDKAKTVNVLWNGELYHAISVPRQIDAEPMGFSLNWAKKNEKGFEISIEYGSRYYFDKTLFFECKKNDFFLTKAVVNSFDKRDPEKSFRKKIVAIKPEVALKDFQVKDCWNDTF